MQCIHVHERESVANNNCTFTHDLIIDIMHPNYSYLAFEVCIKCLVILRVTKLAILSLHCAYEKVKILKMLYAIMC